MRFLPLRNLTLRCDAPPDRVALQIASRTRPKGWTLRVPGGTFFGEVDGCRFRVLLDPPGVYGPRGSRFFHPIARGRIDAAGEGSVVQVSLRPGWSDILAAALTVGIVSIAAVMLVAGARGPAVVEGRKSPDWMRLGLAVCFAGGVTWYVAFLARRFRAGVQEATARIGRALGGVTFGDAAGGMVRRADHRPDGA